MIINKPFNHQHGFTLVELAIVLVIIGVLLGGFIGTLSSRIETTKRANTQQQMEEIKDAILGFAAANKRLPCPATTTSDGDSNPDDGACVWEHGFVPGRTLGLEGSYNRDNLLLDTWGNPIRYSVTNSDGDSFTTTDGMKITTMISLDPDYFICDGSSTSGTGCVGSTTIANNIPFILLSLGEDGNEFVTAVAATSDQEENSGELVVAANTAGENIAYTVGNNQIFVKKDYSSIDSSAGKFDDLIVWVSPYILYSRMIEAGNLP
ncbi:MAG: type II secretion system GspH family protein [Gammaproteobacteria bacterium]|nr:type II secretion system GspH family protein [Gammaproteobacteria bacterium]MCW8922035.1 type II secretion system GspH family protein [Gammaproteobacteria bacterium]